MIRKFVKRCLLAFAFATTVLFVVVGCCLALVSSSPSFYSTALADSIQEADAKAAIEEIELAVGALELFLIIGPENLEQLEALPAEQLARGLRWVPEERLPEVLDLLNRSTDVARETFTISFTERQINAWLSQEANQPGEEIQRPRLSLQGDLVRFGVTLVTPLTEAVVSCDFKPIASNDATLNFELHALRVGRLPMPAATLLGLLMQTNPELPQGLELSLAGKRPVLTITSMPTDGKLQIDDLRVADGELQLQLRRTQDAVVAAR